MIVMTTKDDYLDVLSETMDLEVLPHCVAPGVGKGGGMPDYFDHVHWEGGPIPTRDELDDILKERERQSLLKGEGIVPKLTRVDSDTSTALSSKSRASALSADFGSTINVTGGSMLKGYWRVAPETVSGKFFVVWPSKEVMFE